MKHPDDAPATTSQHLLEVENLSVDFGDHNILNGTAFHLSPGETLGIVGDHHRLVNVTGFADRIQQLVMDTELRGTMSVAARETAMEFAWDSVLARIPTYYNELLADIKSEGSIEQETYKNAPSTDSAVAVH